MIYIVVLYALLASTFTMGKIALVYGSPYFLTAFRMVIAAAMFLGYQYYKTGSIRSISKKDVKLLTITALVYIYIPFLFEFWALQYTSSIKTNIIFSAAPFVSAFFAYVLYHHRLTRLQICALFMGFVGLIPVLVTNADVTLLYDTSYALTLPEIALVIAMVSGAYAWFLIKELSRRGYSLGTINGITMGIGGVLLALTSAIIDIWIPFMRSEPINIVSNIGLFLFWAFALIIVANIVFYPLYGWLLKKYSVTFLSFCGFMSPIFGAFFGWFFINEQVTWHHFISLIIIIASLSLFYQQERKQNNA